MESTGTSWYCRLSSEERGMLGNEEVDNALLGVEIEKEQEK